MVLCASAKTLQMLVLNEVVGPSSGTTTTGDALRVVDARDRSAGADDFCASRGTVDERADTLPGILKGLLIVQLSML